MQFFNRSGTFPSVINLAKPSAIAVFPTPESPTKRGLFLFLRAKICEILSISLFLPINGSIFPSIASWLRFVQNCSNAEESFFGFPSGSSSVNSFSE